MKEELRPPDPICLNSMILSISKHNLHTFKQIEFIGISKIQFLKKIHQLSIRPVARNFFLGGGAFRYIKGQ